MHGLRRVPKPRTVLCLLTFALQCGLSSLLLSIITYLLHVSTDIPSNILQASLRCCWQFVVMPYFYVIRSASVCIAGIILPFGVRQLFVAVVMFGCELESLPLCKLLWNIAAVSCKTAMLFFAVPCHRADSASSRIMLSLFFLALLCGNSSLL